MVYIHELKDWPNFHWEQAALADLLAELRYHQGCLTGSMASIGFHIREDAVLETLTQDVVTSSEIEGERLDQSSVRSSVARHLGIEIASLEITDTNVEGIVDMTLDATQKFDQPLTKERLLHWHAALFPTGRSGITKIKVGGWRISKVEVVSGRLGKEMVHFIGPAPDRVDCEMALFLEWLNRKDILDPVLKAAVAHLWFVTIHPFDDGNGRIARAIADMMLARSENSPCRFYSLSSQIKRERKGYYAILEQSQKGSLEITPWLKWFFSCLKRAIQGTLSTLDLITYKSNFWKSLMQVPVNERQKKIINLMLEGFDGKLTSSKWAKIAKCSQDTAYRDISELVQRGILVKSPEGGRSTNYLLAVAPPK